MQRKKPHILILMTDQLRADFTTMENHSYIKMPCIEELSEHGTYFSNAYTPSPICVPARQSILSGQYPRHCGCRDWGQDIAPDVMTYPKWFGNHGYHTVAAGKMHLQGPDQMKGWQRRIGYEQVVSAGCYQGFEQKEWQEQQSSVPGAGKWIWDDEVKKARYGEGYWSRHDRYTVDGALMFLDEYFADPDYDRIGEQPLLLQVSLLMPHFPYICSEEWFKYYLNRVDPFVQEPADSHPSHGQRRLKIGKDVTMREVQRAWAAYCGMITEADIQFKRVIDKLKHLGVFDDFITVFHSDHGDMLGEHGIWEKFVFFEGAVRTPFFISSPGKKWDKRIIEQNVSLLDIFPTLCEIADIPEPPELDGQSLVSLMNGEIGEKQEACVYSELYSYSVLDEHKKHSWGHGQQLMIKQGDMKYVTYEMDQWQDQLFDLGVDPHERNNLVGKEEYLSDYQNFRDRANEFHSHERHPAFPVGNGRWVYTS